MGSKNLWRITFVTLAVFSLASCSSDPEYADPEAHEMMEKLREQYTPFIIGTWHVEQFTEKQRFFEQLTFQKDGTLSGVRKWQSRELVTINGEQRYTDWENNAWSEGTFTGKWTLLWDRDEKGVGSNQLSLWGAFESDGAHYLAYSSRLSFDYADDTTLCFQSYWFHTEDGVIRYQRGAAEPSF